MYQIYHSDNFDNRIDTNRQKLFKENDNMSNDDKANSTEMRPYQNNQPSYGNRENQDKNEQQDQGKKKNRGFLR